MPGLARLEDSLPKPKPPAQVTGYLDGMFGAIAPVSQVPMRIRELDVLLALCQTAPALDDYSQAEKLATQLKSYLPEAHIQSFSPSEFLHEIRPSPWAVLTYQLTNALLSIGIHHPGLKETVHTGVKSYIANVLQTTETVMSGTYDDTDGFGHPQDATEVAAITVSLMGFMEAAATRENFWSSQDRLRLIQSLQEILSERFLVAVERAASALQHSSHTGRSLRDWRRYLKRYAAKGSPLGAIINDQMRVLEDGADYLQLTSAWQQRLAFSVKAYTLEAYLHCMVLDEDEADADILFVWLEDAIANQVQMADLDLANVVLKSLAVVAKYIP